MRHVWMKYEHSDRNKISCEFAFSWNSIQWLKILRASIPCEQSILETIFPEYFQLVTASFIKLLSSQIVIILARSIHSVLSNPSIWRKMHLKIKNLKLASYVSKKPFCCINASHWHLTHQRYFWRNLHFINRCKVVDSVTFADLDLFFFFSWIRLQS